MMRYNKKSTIYASFGLIVMGMVLVVLNSVSGLVPASSHLYPAWLPRTVARGLLGLAIGLDIFGIMLVGFYTVLQALARMETENRQLQKDQEVMKQDIHYLAITVRRILDREHDRHGPVPPVG